MYPHQVLMEQNNLQDTDLSPEAKGYLKDFNTFIRAINMKQGKAEKAGKEFEMSENDMNKAKRLSKSVCVQIYSDIDVQNASQQAEKEKEEKAKAEAQALKEAQEKEDEEKRLKQQEIENRRKAEREEVIRRRAEEQQRQVEAENIKKQQEIEEQGEYYF